MNAKNGIQIQAAIKTSLCLMLVFFEDGAAEIRCERPLDLRFVYSRNEFRTFTVNDTAKFRCLWPDEDMKGPKMLTCGADGQWKPYVAKRCSSNVLSHFKDYCSDPAGMYSTPDYGKHILGYPANATAYFSCYFGYRVNGPSKLTCSADGFWLPNYYPRCVPSDRSEDRHRIEDDDSYEEPAIVDRQFFSRFDPIKILIVTVLSTIFMVVFALLRAHFCSKRRDILHNLTQLDSSSGSVNNEPQINANLLSPTNPLMFEDVRRENPSRQVNSTQPFHGQFHPSESLPSYEEVTKDDKPPLYEMVCSAEHKPPT